MHAYISSNEMVGQSFMHTKDSIPERCRRPHREYSRADMQSDASPAPTANHGGGIHSSKFTFRVSKMQTTLIERHLRKEKSPIDTEAYRTSIVTHIH
jgi:hypothetical protein